MDLGNLVNENISKKFGLALFSIYLVSKCEDQNIAYVIAAIAVAGILAQGVVDAIKARGDEPITP